MASTIVTKNSSTASAVPVAGDLTKGELAVNVTDKKLYTKDNGGSVVKLVGSLGNQEASAIAITGGAIDGTTVGSTTTAAGAFTTLAASGNFSLSGGTANGVTYLNGSKVLTSGSALTFDGTSVLTIARASGIGNTQITTTNNGAGASGFQFGQSAQQQQFFIYDSGANKDRYIINSSGEHLWLGASEGMRLTSTGLGIGTSSPAYKLDVAGTVNVVNGSNGRINIGKTTNYLYGDSSNNIIIGNSGGDRLQIDTSGNLGLGVTPSAWSGFKVLESTAGNSVYFGSTQASLGSNAYNDGAGWKYKTTAPAGLFTNVQGAYTWYTAGSGTAGNSITFTQAMTLTADGDWILKTTSKYSSAIATISGGLNGVNQSLALVQTDNTGFHDKIQFVNTNGVVGSVSTTGSATSYNTSSDYRLKDNQAPLTGSGEFIDALQPKTWTWKADGSRGVGFIAHEVQEVSPNSVVGEKDGEQMQAMEYGSAEFIANIIAELQSLRKRLADAGIA